MNTPKIIHMDMGVFHLAVRAALLLLPGVVERRPGLDARVVVKLRFTGFNVTTLTRPAKVPLSMQRATCEHDQRGPPTPWGLCATATVHPPDTRSAIPCVISSPRNNAVT